MRYDAAVPAGEVSLLDGSTSDSQMFGRDLTFLNFSQPSYHLRICTTVLRPERKSV